MFILVYGNKSLGIFLTFQDGALWCVQSALKINYADAAPFSNLYIIHLMINEVKSRNERGTFGRDRKFKLRQLLVRLYRFIISKLTFSPSLVLKIKYLYKLALYVKRLIRGKFFYIAN